MGDLIMQKAPSASDPRQLDNADLPTGLQLAGTAQLENLARSIRRSNPPLDQYGRQLNPNMEPFPYYVDNALIRGIRALARKNGPFVKG